MRRRLFPILLALIMVITMIPAFSMTAFAKEGEPYYVWVAGTWVTDANKNNVLGDGTVSFDPDSHTLTLKNANIVGKVFSPSYSGGIILTPTGDYDTFTIRLEGKNTVKGAYSENNSYGILMTGWTQRALIFTGPGSLDVTSDTAMMGDSIAIDSYGKLIIESGTIRATGASAKRYRCGINGEYGVNIRGGDIQTGVSAPIEEDCYGIRCYDGDIRIQGGTVQASGGIAGSGMGRPSKAFTKEPVLSGYPGTPSVLWSSDASGAGAKTWNGSPNLADSGVQYVTISPEGSGGPNPFADISKGDYWYGPILWAYYHVPQITNGMDATHFGPNITVTRAQAMTFLWRAAGQPEPAAKTNPFQDVPAWEYYYKPVLWAVEKGITKGTTETTFAPNDTLSTAHMITFLYRSQKPGKDGWYEEAANWSYDSNHLPFGVSLKVDNETDCPRGAVVTFLYRCLEAPVADDPIKAELTHGAGAGYHFHGVSATGGVAPYTYQWQERDSNGNWKDVPDPPLDHDQHLAGGTYRCKVTDSKGNYIYTDSVEVKAELDKPPTHQVNVGAVRVRSGPSSTSSEIGGLTLGKQVAVVETYDGWSQIIYGDGWGWVMSQYLSPL